MIWLLPVGVALVVALPMLFSLRRAAREARMLSQDVAALVELREPVADLRASILSLREDVPQLRGRTVQGALRPRRLFRNAERRSVDGQHRGA